MKFKVITLIISIFCSALLSLEAITDTSKNHYISTEYNILYYKNQNFNFGKKNNWEFELNFEFSNSQKMNILTALNLI